MTDEQLAARLNMPVSAFQKLYPEKQDQLRRLVQTAEDLNAWKRGEGPKPEGVLIDEPRERRKNR